MPTFRSEVAGFGPVPAMNIDGKTKEQFMADAREAAAKTPEGRLRLLEAEIAKRKGQQAKLQALEAEIEARKLASVVDTSPRPTGIERIDRAGETLPHQFGSGPFATQVERQIPSMDDLPFDHPDVLRKQRAEEGVDMISGAPADIRADMASGGPLQRQKQASLLASIKENTLNVPEGVPKFRWDGQLNEFQVMMPSENEGKFRWTSLDGTGLEVGDFADMLNPAELLSLVGGVTGTFTGPSKLRYLNLGKTNAGSPALGGTAGALAGRYLGDTISFVAEYNRTGDAPTHEELYQHFKGGFWTEIAATALTEAGAKILRTTGQAAQDFALKRQGLQGTTATEDLTRVNKNIEDAQKLLADMNQDGMKYSITHGQATRSIPDLASEAHRLKGANSATKEQFATAQAQNDQALRHYVRKNLGGDIDLLADHEGLILRANDALSEPGRFTIALTDQGNMHVLPKMATGANMENGLPGLVVDIQDPKVWQVRTVQTPEELQRLGLAESSYKVAAEEAYGNGAVLGSSDQLLPDGVELWKAMDAKGTLGKLKWHPDAYVPPHGGLMTPSGEPVVRMVEPPAITPQLLDGFMEPGQLPTGQMEANLAFRDFLRAPGALLKPVVKEMETSPLIRQNMKEAIFADYEKRVKKAKGFDLAEWQGWKESVKPVLEKTFSPEELIEIYRRPHNLRAAVEKSRESLLLRRQGIARELNVPVDDKMLLDPSMRGIFQQIKKRDPESRRRTMRLLDAADMGDEFRKVFLHEIQQDVLQKSNRKNYLGFNKWLSQNQKIISDVMGDTQYSSDLLSVGRALQRKTDGGMIRGAAGEANPTGLALFRVVFGPLSRIQRGLTGLRRGQVRMNAANAADLISDPEKLRKLAHIRPLEVSSRVVARTIQDLDLHVAFGMPDFDPDNEEQRLEMADRVMVLLQEELSENVEPR
jgi:hypothetical protein